MKTVFIVDDDASIREMLSRLLSRHGHRVCAFSTPLEAMSRMAAESPDLLISDVHMPGMTGIEFVERIREQGEALPVILVTGRLDESVLSSAERLGVYRVFAKPIRDLSGFVAFVREMMPEDKVGRRPDSLQVIRRDFLAALSHEIRTPLTAIKLALDGLFPQADPLPVPAHEKLVGISRRNLDRIIDVVERQLGLLQLTVGDPTMTRRLTDLNRVLERHRPRTQSGAGQPVALPAFVDPERLRTIVQCVAAWLGPNALPSVSATSSSVDLVFDNVVPADSGALGSMSAGFTLDACRQAVEAMGGCMDQACGESPACGSRITLRLPLVPAFNRRFDLELPLRSFYRAATLSDRPATLIRCQLEYSSEVPSEVSRSRFLGDCMRVLGDGDIAMRGNDDGLFYVGLLGWDHDAAAAWLNDLEHATAMSYPAYRVTAEINCHFDPSQDEDDLLDKLESVTAN